MNDAPDWNTDGADWPNRAASRFVEAAGITWHVQVMGQGPAVLLLHGTGAATHSWRDLAPLLARAFTVVAPDLPGHGFTGKPPSEMLSLPGMARAVSALLKVLDVRPAIAVGHSAGAPVALRMTLDHAIDPVAVVSLNGALMPMRGLVGMWFKPIAQFMACWDIVPRIFAWNARDRRTAERLLTGTGSRVDEHTIDLYHRLFKRPRHAASALGMMARWDLTPLLRELPRLDTDLVLVVGENDTTVPPSDSTRAGTLCPGTRLVTLPGLGHLAHEEDADAVAEIISETARSHQLGHAA